MPAPSSFPSPPPRPLTIEVFGRAAVVALPGDLRHHADDGLVRTLQYAVACGHQHLVLDFTPATSVDRRSFAILVDALTRLELHPHGAVVLAGAGAIGDLLDVRDGDLLFTSFPSRGDALRALRDPSRRMQDGWRTAILSELTASLAAKTAIEVRLGSSV